MEEEAAQHSGQTEKVYWGTPLSHFYNAQRCWEGSYHWVQVASCFEKYRASEGIKNKKTKP